MDEVDWLVSVLEIIINAFFKWTSTDDDPCRKYGHRRSLIRMIGTLLPLPKAKRVHLGMAVWNRDAEFIYSSTSTDDGIETSPAFEGSEISTNTEDMKKLLDEIGELKEKINEIVKMQYQRTCCSGSLCCNAQRPQADRHANLVSSEVTPAPAPPPPPPPPPLPLLNHNAPVSSSTPTGRSKFGKIPYAEPKSHGLSAVLDELKRSKIALKPIPRSPNARTKKSPSNSLHNKSAEDSLAEILRKRLSYTQYSDSDCSSVHSDYFNSP